MFCSFPSLPSPLSFFQTTLPVQPAPHLPAQSRPLPTLTLQEQATVHIKNPPPDPGNKQIRELRRIPTERMDSSSTSLQKGEVSYKERRLFLKKTVRVSSSTIQKRHAHLPSRFPPPIDPSAPPPPSPPSASSDDDDRAPIRRRRS